MAFKDIMQRFSAGFGQRLQPAEQLATMGLTPDQIAAAQTQALRRFGMGMLSNIGTGNGFGAGLGMGFQAAGPELTQSLGQAAQFARANRTEQRDVAREAKGDTRYEEERKYRQARDQVTDQQRDAEMKQRATIAEAQIAAQERETRARIAAAQRLQQTPSPADLEKIREAAYKRSLISTLSAKPYSEMSENEKALWEMATGGATSDLQRANSAGGLFGGLGGFGVPLPAAPGAAAPAPVPAPAAGGFRYLGPE